MKNTALALVALLLLTGCASGPAAPGSNSYYAGVLASPPRSAADLENDKRRDPTELLAFTGAQPGMKALDMGAGAGYSTELMARAVGPTGHVWGQDSSEGTERNKAKVAERLQSPAMQHAHFVARPYDDPVPPEAKPLDIITFFFAYHDTTFMPVDRAKMNKAFFNALRPGGYLIIADHAAAPGSPIGVGKTLHRIDEDTLKREVMAAGFKLVAEGNFLRSSQDTHDAPIFRLPVPVDNFVLKFQKPGG